MEQTHRHTQLLLKLACHEVTAGRESARRLGAADLPLAGAILGGNAGGQLGHFDMPDLGIVGRGDLFLRIEATGDNHLHVRLPGAKPDLADQHVIKCDGVLADNLNSERPARRHLRQHHAPLTGFVGRCGHGRLAAYLHGDLLIGIGPPPNRDRLIALQNHVAAEDVRHGDVGRCRSCDSKSGRQHDGVCKREDVLHRQPILIETLVEDA